MLRAVQQVYQEQQKQQSMDSMQFVGVELVRGWVQFAQEYAPYQHQKLHIYEGDITAFTLPVPYTGKTFDFVMLNDVLEHIQKKRYGCFFDKLKEVTHPGSLVYMHTPTPEAQLKDSGQYYENVLPHHYVVLGMVLAGFELVTFQHDMETECGGDKQVPPPLDKTRCALGGFPKYYHALFLRKEDERVFQLK